MTDQPKAILKRYLQRDREALLWKIDGVRERDARLPRTPTGTSLVGIVKHCANVEIGYFGLTFDRAWPTPEDACYVPLTAYDDDPQADWYLPAEVSTGDLVDFYRRVWEFSDAAIDGLPLDATGAPPWWGPAADNQVTLQHMLVRVIDDLARHLGQADVIRESVDGAVGLDPLHPNIPDDGFDWAAYLAKLTRIARRFPEE
ncbi:MAG: DinB family protein [Nocardioides sp.]|uniref:DinB family protein n=1 Tax=Nocardioides sp. TaxID=35761 RepID=UPI0039E69BA8